MSKEEEWERGIEFTEEQEETIDKLAEDIMNMIEGTIIPKTQQMTPEECEQFKKDPNIDFKVETVSNLLKAQNFRAASKDVNPCNIKEYARWVLHSAKNKIKLTNPITRESWADPKAEKLFYSLEELFDELDLL